MDTNLLIQLLCAAQGLGPVFRRWRHLLPIRIEAEYQETWHKAEEHASGLYS